MDSRSEDRRDELTVLVPSTPPPVAVTDPDEAPSARTPWQKVRLIALGLLALWIVAGSPVIDMVMVRSPAALSGGPGAQDEISTLGRIHANLRTIADTLEARAASPFGGGADAVGKLRDEAMATATVAEDLAERADDYARSGRGRLQSDEALAALDARADAVGEEVKRFYAALAVRIIEAADDSRPEAERQARLDALDAEAVASAARVRAVADEVMASVARRIGVEGVGR